MVRQSSVYGVMRNVIRQGVAWRVAEPHVGGYEFWDDWEMAGWEQHTLDVVDRYVTKGSTMVDIGGWIGPVALWAANRGAHVISVEPDPVALKYLRANVLANKANVTIFRGAISDDTGMAHISPDVTGWGSSMTKVAVTGTEVPCLTLPDLFDVYDIEDCSLVKMDIEGYESVVLEHVAPFLASLEIPLLVAMHQPWWSRPVEKSWFKGFSSLEGNLGGWEQALAIP